MQNLRLNVLGHSQRRPLTLYFNIETPTQVKVQDSVPSFVNAEFDAYNFSDATFVWGNFARDEAALQRLEALGESTPVFACVRVWCVCGAFVQNGGSCLLEHVPFPLVGLFREGAINTKHPASCWVLVVGVFKRPKAKPSVRA